MGKFAFIVAVVLFAVALVILLFVSGGKTDKVIEGFTLGGFVALALGHVI